MQNGEIMVIGINKEGEEIFNFNMKGEDENTCSPSEEMSDYSDDD